MRALYLPFFTLVVFSPAVFAQDTSPYPELPRFQQVTDRLYRGGQPRDGGLQRLRELGIDTIVNLRGTSKTTKAEEVEARALGFNYFNVALPNWGRPQDEQVRRALLIIAAPQNGRVYVHCKDGVDRTGTIVALHRVTHQGWKTDDALAEADVRGMRRYQFWMRDYAEEYAARAHLFPYEADFDDRLGASMRFVEKGAFRAGKFGRQMLRRAPGKIGGFLNEVF